MREIIFLFMILILSVSCFAAYPTLNDYVTDNANIIKNDDALVQLIKQIEQQTTVEIAVVTVDSLDGLDIETYAVELFEKAGIGKKDIDNGLLILVAPNERKYRIEVGYGLESTIPDIIAREIGVNVLAPNFRNSDYDKGIYDALVVVDGYLTNNEEVISKYKANYSVKKPAINTIIMIIILLIILSSMFRRTGFVPIFLPGFGGGFRGGMSGGFGGFGGGMSGGGGFSGGW